MLIGQKHLAGRYCIGQVLGTMTAVKQEAISKSPQADEEEVSKVKQIMDVMCETCDAKKALTFLRRNNGDVEKTIMALFDSAADSGPTSSGTNDYSELRAAAAGVVASHTPPSEYIHIQCTMQRPIAGVKPPHRRRRRLQL